MAVSQRPRLTIFGVHSSGIAAQLDFGQLARAGLVRETAAWPSGGLDLPKNSMICIVERIRFDINEGYLDRFAVHPAYR